MDKETKKQLDEILPYLDKNNLQKNIAAVESQLAEAFNSKDDKLVEYYSDMVIYIKNWNS